MMNQYRDRYNRAGSRSPRCGDVSPYRRPLVRDDVTQRSFNRPGGCGCGMGRTTPQSVPYGNGSPCSTPRTPRESGACGCDGGSVSINCKKLMEQIRTVDFALYETVLYLDVYPHSCDALETYRKLRAQSEALHAEYEAACGPLTAFGNRGDTWDWMSGPFPWEYGAE
ncbi:MAG: spore coat protein CotJB [Clostridia bacterium]|nr:spore coat protein CotJB [Clostridia bacterium]